MPPKRQKKVVIIDDHDPLFDSEPEPESDSEPEEYDANTLDSEDKEDPGLVGGDPENTEPESDIELDETEIMTFVDEVEEAEKKGDHIVGTKPEGSIRIYTIVKPEDRISSERLSLFECARILGDRARHLDNGAPPYVDTTKLRSSLEIAYTELISKKIPMCIVRHRSATSVEIWRLREMTLPSIPSIDWFSL